MDAAVEVCLEANLVRLTHPAPKIITKVAIRLDRNTWRWFRGEYVSTFSKHEEACGWAIIRWPRRYLLRGLSAANRIRV
jgi:hypothetical protein